MLKALWFMAKVGVLVALALWLAERPGSVRIEWLDYTITVHVGLFTAVLIGLILFSIFLYNVIRTFVDFPKSYARYLEIRRRDKGYRALTLGLTAVAAGDTKTAVHHSQRAQKFMPEDQGLPLLLSAQAARLDGREEDARASFTAMLESKDASFLGVRGLLQAALDLGQNAKALEFARQALALHPKQPWILKTVYDLEIRQRDWAAARKTLERAERAGAIVPERARADRVAMLLAESDAAAQAGRHKDALAFAKKAAALDGAFAPAVSRLARLYNLQGKRNAAVRLIEKAWKESPHPDYVAVWEILEPRGTTKKPMGRMQWMEKLLAQNAAGAVGQMAAGRAAMEHGLWGEARAYLRRAEELEPSAPLYRLMAELEERSGQNEEAALPWMEKAAVAPPGKAWVCRQSGRVYESWMPVTGAQGVFNTLTWDVPEAVHEFAQESPQLKAPGV